MTEEQKEIIIGHIKENLYEHIHEGCEELYLDLDEYDPKGRLNIGVLPYKNSREISKPEIEELLEAFDYSNGSYLYTCRDNGLIELLRIDILRNDMKRDDSGDLGDLLMGSDEIIKNLFYIGYD